VIGVESDKDVNISMKTEHAPEQFVPRSSQSHIGKKIRITAEAVEAVEISTSSLLENIIKEESIDLSRRSKSIEDVKDGDGAISNKSDGDEIVFDDIDSDELDDEDYSDLIVPSKGGPAIDPSVLENRKVAKEFRPHLQMVLLYAINSPEALTGSNFLRDMLCAHDSVPPLSMVTKLMDFMKYGPKAEGRNVYFKDPYKTELVSQYVYGLLWASRRLVRRDKGALFGPSSWDDIQVLLEQSIKQTENMVFGRRLAQGLQLAARGAKLLSMLLLTELQGHDLYSTAPPVALDTRSLPSVRIVKSYGVRNALKVAVQQMTKCLVRHSRWVMDSGGIELSTTKSTSDESCCLEARECLDNLGSVVCAIAWLFCNEGRVGIDDNSVAFVIKDSFLVEVERSLENCPEMNERNKRRFTKKCKMYFLMSMKEEFAEQMIVTVGGMLGCKDDLRLVGLGKLVESNNPEIYFEDTEDIRSDFFNAANADIEAVGNKEDSSDQQQQKVAISEKSVQVQLAEAFTSIETAFSRASTVIQKKSDDILPPHYIQWPGNIHFQRVIKPLKSIYQQSNQSKQSAIVDMVLSGLNSQGRRFLTQIEADSWKELDAVAAKDRCIRSLEDKIDNH